MQSVFDSLLGNPLNWVLVAVDLWLLKELVSPLPKPPTPVHQEPILLRNFSLKELRVFGGATPGTPLLIGVNGRVYDVARGRHFYGPGSPLSSFSSTHPS